MAKHVVDYLLSTLAGWWTDTVAALLPSWITVTPYFDVNKVYELPDHTVKLPLLRGEFGFENESGGRLSLTLLTLSLAAADDWQFGHVVCQFWLSVDYTASTASIFNLFILSLDRYWSGYCKIEGEFKPVRC